METAYRALWAEVFIHAVKDGVKPKPKEATLAQYLDWQRDREWITDDNSDFNVVASLAGLEPTAARERIAEMLK